MFTPSEWQHVLAPLELLKDCIQCPRECRADRTGSRVGYCSSGTEFAVGSICAHRGEEPVISGKHGICNTFFMHCNMQCVFCQNWQISRKTASLDGSKQELADIIEQIERLLDSGCTGVGFVSPSHYIPQMRAIMTALRLRDRHPVYVFNTNGYDKVETIRSLEGEIQVYLPDLKYMDNRLAQLYSDTPHYVEFATAALREMYRQKGAAIYVDDSGSIQIGLIIRHLVLPGQVANSIAALRFIAEELSPDVHISLMSQYHPIPGVEGHKNLGRLLYAEEYEKVLAEFDRLGFHRGWVQELTSPQHYRPDFDQDHPFER